MRLNKTFLHYFNLTLVIATGLLGIISVVNFPQLDKLLLLSKLIPFPITLASRTLTLLFSIAMLTLALNLHRRRRRAHRLLLLLTTATIFTHLMKGLDLFEASLTFLTFLSLITTSDLYRQPSRPFNFKLQLQRNTLFLLLLIFYLILTTIWLHFHPPSHFIAHYIHLSLDLSLIFLEIYFFAAFFAPMAIGSRQSHRHRQRAHHLILHSSQPDYLNFLKLTPDKTIFLSSNHQAFLSYKIVNQYTLALGDPVGHPSQLDQLLLEFQHFLDRYTLKPLFYQISPYSLPHLQNHHFKTFPLGREALIDLKHFSIPNLKTSKLRQTYRKLLRRHFTTQIIHPPYSSTQLKQLKQISDSWLTLPHHHERQFSVGYFSTTFLRYTPIFLVLNPQKQVIAWTNLHLFPHQKFATADLLRYSANIPNGTIEFLFISLFLHLKEQGYHTFSLGLAPLPPELSPKEKLIAQLLKKLSFIFRFAGVTNFKAKFATHWQTRYLAYRQPQDLLLYPSLFHRATKLP